MPGPSGRRVAGFLTENGKVSFLTGVTQNSHNGVDAADEMFLSRLKKEAGSENMGRLMAVAVGLSFLAGTSAWAQNCSPELFRDLKQDNSS
jgi:hypothetical protein